MAAKEPIINTFNGGMNLDSVPSLQPKTTYRYAKNLVLSDRESMNVTLSSEESIKLSAKVGKKVVGHFLIESLNTTVILSEGDTIGIFDHDKETYKDVASASEFGCSWGFNTCEWIVAEYKFLNPCDEIYVYFSSKCTYYRINLTELLSETRKAALIDSFSKSTAGNCEFNCDYFKLMNCICTPKITSDVSENGGHRLEGGVYRFATQLEDKEGNTTNWSEVGQPIYIGSESNLPGEITSASINVHLTGLDCRYDVVNIAVIDGYSSAEVVASIPYSTDGITYNYYGQSGRAIDLGEIIVKTKRHLRGRSVIQKDSRLYLYNIRQEKNPNMQRRVFDSARLQFITIQTSAKTAERYNLKSYQRGERYLFGVVYKYCDGTHSPVFLLSNAGSGGGGSFSSAQASPATGTEERYERVPGNTRTGTKPGGGCSSGNCGGGDTASPRSTSPSDPTVESGVIDSWSTDINNYENSAKCNDCHPPICCQTDDEGNVTTTIIDTAGNCDGCSEDEQAIGNDGPKLEEIEVNQMDTITEWGYNDNKEVSSTSWVDSAKNLLEYIDQAEVIKRTKLNYNITTSVGGGSTGSGSGGVSSEESSAQANTGRPQDPTQSLSNDIKWGDEFHNLSGRSDLDGSIKIVERWAPKKFFSTQKYPDSRDCDGQPLYGSKANSPVELFGTPNGNESPIVIATEKGVPNRVTPAIDPAYAANIRLLGIEVNNVPMPGPDDDWFPKPLCPNEPWRIVSVDRDQINSTIQANCFATSTFQGNSGGQPHYFPRHGLCSRDKCDYHVQNGDSHLGTTGGNVYNLYSLDTGLTSVGLSASSIIKNARVNAQGYRYGLYAVGENPADRLGGNRIDQRGANQMLNANLFQPEFSELDVEGISYVPSNTRSMTISGINDPVTTAYRESSVFVGLSGSLGNPEDNSFKMDTLDHEAPIWNAHGWNVSLKRDIPDQYGGVVGMKFSDTGVRANGYTNSTRGIAGDVYIGPYSFVKKGFVSEKVGNTFATPGRDRTVCDSPDELLLQNLDINHYPTRLPKSGDKSDARNWAGGYLDQNALVVQGAATEPTRDFYYPKVTKSLIVTWLESRNNPWKRATGAGDQSAIGQVYYPKLKGMFLSANEGAGRPWEKSFLNKFYYKLEQPSPAQLLRKAIIRNIVEIIIPALGYLELSSKQLPTDISSYFYVLPGLISYWKLMRDVVIREDYLNKLVGISDCKTDEEGGEPDNNIVDFDDNYHNISSQYQVNTKENFYKTMPLSYNTCVCDDCTDANTTNEIYISNKQMSGSTVDVYKSFQALPYNEISGDRGKIRKIFKLESSLFVHTTEGLFLVKTKDNDLSKVTSYGMRMLVGTSMISEPVQLMEGTVEGILGLQDPNASINTPYGYFFIDREAKRIYRFDGKKPEEVSALGMYNFFKDNIDFCELGDCHDEKKEGSTFYSLGWDNRFNRLLVTKNSSNSDESFTISYSPEMNAGKGAWTSFHDYQPQSYLWDRNKLFSIKDGSIYRHNQEHSYLNFYDGIFPMEVEYVTNLEAYEWFHANSFSLHTEATITRDNIKGLDTTFNKYAAWNFTQGTGTLNFKLFSDNKDTVLDLSDRVEQNPGELKMSMSQRRFDFNGVRDFKMPSCVNKPMVLMDKCSYYPKVNESIFDCSSSVNVKSTDRMIDDHISQKLIYDPVSEDIRLRLIETRTNYSQQPK